MGGGTLPFYYHRSFWRPILRRTPLASKKVFRLVPAFVAQIAVVLKREKLSPRGCTSACALLRTPGQPRMKSPEPKPRPLGGDCSPIVSILPVRSSWCQGWIPSRNHVPRSWKRSISTVENLSRAKTTKSRGHATKESTCCGGLANLTRAARRSIPLDL